MKTSKNNKVKIYNQIDSLDDKILEELYAMIKNFINGKSDITAWGGLSTT